MTLKNFQQFSDANSDASGLQFIDFQNDGSASNPILGRDEEGSGLMYDEEGSGSNQLLFDPVDQTNDQSVSSPAVFEHTINVTNSDVDTLVIKVLLPQRNSSQLLDDLKDDSAQQTNPINTLNTAVSLTEMLNELLGRIQDATNA
uniref:Uncharacterized protein n=1 Tax=Caenorhabditis japonica TaxID=281687 RepID=A0A8R1DW36_CAEJA